MCFNIVHLFLNLFHKSYKLFPIGNGIISYLSNIIPNILLNIIQLQHMANNISIHLVSILI